jgi:hypothetical protein
MRAIKTENTPENLGPPPGTPEGEILDLPFRWDNQYGYKEVVSGISVFRHPVEITRSVQRDLRPFIYEGMMDEIAVQAIARAHRPVGDSNLGSAESWTPTISLDSSSANGRNG